jgi:hypothetical protein
LALDQDELVDAQEDLAPVAGLEQNGPQHTDDITRGYERSACRVFGLGLEIVFVILGSPNQMPTILGLLPHERRPVEYR